MSNNPDDMGQVEAPSEANLKAKPPKEKSPPALSVYLGSAEQSARRLRALDDIAERLNLRGRSTLIQWIADGRLQLVVPATRYVGSEHELNASPWLWTQFLKNVSARGGKSKQIFGNAPAIAEDQRAEIKRFIADNIDTFAKNGHGWHEDIMSAIMEKFAVPSGYILPVWTLVREEAERRHLSPYYEPKRSKAAPESGDQKA